MGTPAAVLGDSVIGSCLHTYQSTTPSPGGPVPSPVPMTLPFKGSIMEGVPTVLICGKPAVTLGASVVNTSVHPPMGGVSIPGPAVPPATNKATIIDGSPTVIIGEKPIVRTGCKTTPECGLTGPAIVQGTATTVLIA